MVWNQTLCAGLGGGAELVFASSWPFPLSTERCLSFLYVPTAPCKAFLQARSFAPQQHTCLRWHLSGILRSACPKLADPWSLCSGQNFLPFRQHIWNLKGRTIKFLSSLSGIYLGSQEGFVGGTYDHNLISQFLGLPWAWYSGSFLPNSGGQDFQGSADAKYTVSDTYLYLCPQTNAIPSVCVCVCVCVCLVSQSCLTLCDHMDCSIPGLPVPHHHPILLVKKLRFSDLPNSYKEEVCERSTWPHSMLLRLCKGTGLSAQSAAVAQVEETCTSPWELIIWLSEIFVSQLLNTAIIKIRNAITYKKINYSKNKGNK